MKLSKEIVDVWDDHIAYIDCRDACISKVFGYKKAAYFSKQAYKSKRKFWAMVEKLYPETAGKRMSYIHEKEEIKIDDSIQ